MLKDSFCKGLYGGISECSRYTGCSSFRSITQMYFWVEMLCTETLFKSQLETLYVLSILQSVFCPSKMGTMTS